MALLVVFMLLLFAFFAPNDCWPLSRRKERFDTYKNHDVGVYEVLRDQAVKPKDVAEAGQWSKYNWRDKDPTGITVYDRVYEEWAKKQNYAPEDDDYARRVLDESGNKDAYLDNRFEVLGGENALATYSYADMAGRQPGTVFNGEVLTLAQKNN